MIPNMGDRRFVYLTLCIKISDKIIIYEMSVLNAFYTKFLEFLYETYGIPVVIQCISNNYTNL